METLNYQEMHTQHMAKKKFTVIIEKDEDGAYIGTVPDLKGCYSYGASLDELILNVKEAIAAHLELYKKEKRQVSLSRFSGVQEVEIEV
jgi:predicted RNase H-like HicB family nuclease